MESMISEAASILLIIVIALSAIVTLKSDTRRTLNTGLCSYCDGKHSTDEHYQISIEASKQQETYYYTTAWMLAR